MGQGKGSVCKRCLDTVAINSSIVVQDLMLSLIIHCMKIPQVFNCSPILACPGIFPEFLLGKRFSPWLQPPCTHFNLENFHVTSLVIVPPSILTLQKIPEIFFFMIFHCCEFLQHFTAIFIVSLEREYRCMDFIYNLESQDIKMYV